MNSPVTAIATPELDYSPYLLNSVVESAYDMLADRPLAGGLIIPRPTANQVVGELGVCYEASDAVTRAAHNLGLVAIRELHEEGIHYITSLSPLDQHPADEDVIICLTWGQFSPKSYAARPGAFIGPRKDMAKLIDPSDYRDAYAPGSVTLRQVTHTAPKDRFAEHVWLKTSSEDLTDGNYSIGEVPADNFSFQDWQFPHLLRA